MVALVLLLSVVLLLLGLVVVVLDVLVGVGESVLPLVEGPRGELAVFECCFDMVQVPYPFCPWDD